MSDGIHKIRCATFANKIQRNVLKQYLLVFIVTPFLVPGRRQGK